MYFVVTLALKILIYASVNCGFSGFASLKLHLFIQPLKLKEMTNLLFSLLLLSLDNIVVYYLVVLQIAYAYFRPVQILHRNKVIVAITLVDIS